MGSGRSNAKGDKETYKKIPKCAHIQFPNRCGPGRSPTCDGPCATSFSRRRGLVTSTDEAWAVCVSSARGTLGTTRGEKLGRERCLIAADDVTWSKSTRSRFGFGSIRAQRLIALTMRTARGAHFRGCRVCHPYTMACLSLRTVTNGHGPI